VRLAALQIQFVACPKALQSLQPVGSQFFDCDASQAQLSNYVVWRDRSNAPAK
jgi:hypothetical protein